MASVGAGSLAISCDRSLECIFKVLMMYVPGRRQYYVVCECSLAAGASGVSSTDRSHTWDAYSPNSGHAVGARWVAAVLRHYFSGVHEPPLLLATFVSGQIRLPAVPTGRFRAPRGRLLSCRAIWHMHGVMAVRAYRAALL